MEMTEIIATRRLQLLEDDGSTKPILIELGKPKLFPDSTNYYAPFQILGIGSERVLYAGGVDAFQALQLVMGVIGAQLAALNQACGDRLRREGHEGSEFGFPDSILTG